MKNFIFSLLIVTFFILLLFGCSIDSTESADSLKNDPNTYLKVFSNNSTNENMIYNGDFDNGTNGWYLYTGAGSVADMSVINGAMVVDITDSGSSTMELNLGQSGLTFTKNKAYIVSFKAKVDAPRHIYVKAGMITDPWIPLYSPCKKFELTTSYQTCTFTFTMTENTDTNSHLEFLFGYYAETKIYLDDIVVKEITNNQISNGAFSTRTMQDWEGYIREGTSGRVYILQASNPYASVWHYRGDNNPEPWDLELKQLGLTLIQGKTYACSFDAWTRRYDRVFKVNYGLHQPPWTEYAGSNYFNLTTYDTEYKHLNKYSFTFTMENPTDYEAYLAFQCGGDYGRNCVYIDNVVLVEVDELID